MKLDGFKEFLTKLAELEAKDLKAKQVVKKNGAEMHAKAQRYAPVDTGTLKRSITLEIKDNGMTAEVDGGHVNYAVYQEYGTRYQSGTPFIRPSHKEQKEIFKKEMRDILK